MHKNKGILVLGHPRSGTTLLRRLLDAHSAIASPPETHLFSACARFIQSDLTSDGLDMGVLAGLHFAGFTQIEIENEIRTLAFNFLNKIANNQGKRRWAEKTAFDIFYLNEIEKLFKDKVFYLGIIRHPLDVALSSKEFCDAAGTYPKKMHEYIQQYPQPIEAFVHSWVDTTNNLIELGNRNPDNCLICRYEDLVNEPAEILSDIFKSLGESMEDKLLEKALSTTGVLGLSDHKAYEHGNIHTKSIEKWKKIPTHQIARFAPILNPLLELCGYDILPVEESHSLNDIRNRYINSLFIRAATSKQQHD